MIRHILERSCKGAICIIHELDRPFRPFSPYSRLPVLSLFIFMLKPAASLDLHKFIH